MPLFGRKHKKGDDAKGKDKGKDKDKTKKKNKKDDSDKKHNHHDATGTSSSPLINTDGTPASPSTPARSSPDITTTTTSSASSASASASAYASASATPPIPPCQIIRKAPSRSNLKKAQSAFAKAITRTIIGTAQRRGTETEKKGVFYKTIGHGVQPFAGLSEHLYLKVEDAVQMNK
ncbi:hypothetical protein Pelo_17690 [Pelomyxa schiedti]|nr:hypothetical protein Pelo_17690 [Pelomyxa schiedti]